jgi:8-oxo-dGTP pyrophosphatase MutT (NUDIX family)
MDIDVKVSAIIEYQGKIALIREKLTKNHNYKWNVCGGGWEPSDGSFQNAVIREAREEAGLEVVVGELYRLVLVKLEVGYTLRVFFTAQANSDSFRLAKREQQAELEEDIVECRWFAKSEIAAWEDSEFVSSTTAKVIKDYTQGKKFSPTEQAIYLDHQTRF